MQRRNFQQIILTLQQYWDRHGCALQQPYDLEVGAGTMADSLRRQQLRNHVAMRKQSLPFPLAYSGLQPPPITSLSVP